MMPFRPAPLAERLAARVERRGPNECWPWTGPLFGKSVKYGQLKSKGRNRPAHRVALELHLGRELAPGMSALHTCDNGGCCNWAHLYEGTPADNMRDKVERGRARGAAVGERHHMAKLTNAQTEEVRARRRAGELLRVLAGEFDVSESRVSQIGRGL